MTDAVMLTENALRSVASDIEIYYKKKAPNGSWCIATCQNAAEQFASMREKLERLQAENATLKAERDAAVEDMNHIASRISECKQFLSGGEDRVSCLNLGRCEVCSGICHDDEPCQFEWRGAKAKEESENG